MEKGELANHFIASVILLAKVQSLIKDNFFYSRFTDKIFGLSSDLFNFSAKEGGDDVIQRQILAEKCISDISGLIDNFKEFRYLGLVKNTPLLLKAEFSLLTVRLGILKHVKEFPLSPRGSTLDLKKGRTSEILKVESKFSHSIESQKLTPSKKKIFDYIKSYPNTRTKDIIYEFSALSGRSVKRNLTDLLKSGLVKKRVDNKAVYYYANDIREVQPRI